MKTPLKPASLHQIDALAEIVVSAEQTEQKANTSPNDEKSDSIRQLIKSRIVRFSDPQPEHVYCASLGGQHLASLGNLGVISGKKKSRKSFLVSSFVASLIRGSYLNFESYLPSGKTKILYIDTEQGKFHVWQLVQSVVGMGGKGKQPDELSFLRMRGVAPEMLIESIDVLLQDSKGIGAMIIDGARDLVYSINDEQECKKVTTQLEAWSEKYDMHITTILHENKGNDLLRGHLGTELQNKAEYVLSVRYVDESVSEVVCVDSREQRPKSFAFSVDENRHTQIVQDYVFEQEGKAKRSRQYKDFDQQTHKNILTHSFKNKQEHSQTSLINAMQATLQNTINETVGKVKLRAWIKEYELEGLIKDATPEKQANTWVLHKP